MNGLPQMATIKETGAIRLCEETNMAKRKPKQPITALWLLEHADSPGNYVIAMDDAFGRPDNYLAMSSLKTASGTPSRCVRRSLRPR